MLLILAWHPLLHGARTVPMDKLFLRTTRYRFFSWVTQFSVEFPDVHLGYPITLRVALYFQRKLLFFFKAKVVSFPYVAARGQAALFDVVHFI